MKRSHRSATERFPKTSTKRAAVLLGMGYLLASGPNGLAVDGSVKVKPDSATGSFADSRHTSEYNEDSLHKAFTPTTMTVTSATLSALGVTNPMTFSKTVDNAGGKTCLVNKAEVAVGFTSDLAPYARFGATFNLDLTKFSVKNITTSLVEPASGSKAPYRVKVTYEVPDFSITTAREADISIECMGFDRNITLSFSGLKGTVYLLAYGPGKADPAAKKYFEVESGTNSLTMNDIKVNTDALIKIPKFTVLATLMEKELNKSSSKDSLAASIGGAIGGGLASAVETFLNLTFTGQSIYASGVNSSDLTKLKEVTFYTSSRSSCSKTPCALYLWK